LLSKGRYLAAQLLAMLDDDLWLDCARASNAGAALLAQAAGERLVHPVDANEVFLRVTPDEAASLRGKGFDFYDWGPGEARLVISWNQREEQIRPLADAIAAL
jgi:threonine aldolase